MEILPGMSNYCTVLFDVNVTAKRQRKPDRYVYQYKKGGIGGVKDDMKEYSDQFLKSNPQNNTVEENWTNFKETLIEVMNKHILQKKDLI